MPKEQQYKTEIKDLITAWVIKVGISNSVDFFDINKVSESTSQHLLNLIFSYRLKDLNRLKRNYPGIDLGDIEVSKIAFQVTSRDDITKIIGSLKIFKDNNLLKDFTSGLKFLILKERKRQNFKSPKLKNYNDFFDPKRDILYASDLIDEIMEVYKKDVLRFNEIKDFLVQQFANTFENGKSSLLTFNDFTEQLVFYRSLFAKTYSEATKNFVPFFCEVNGIEVVTDNLLEIILSENGAVLSGPSGCGKSALAKMIAGTFTKALGVAVIVEAKYYEADLSVLFDKAAEALGFKSISYLLHKCQESDSPVLLIVDALNECVEPNRSKLVLELKEIVKRYNIKCLITSQSSDLSFEDLNLSNIVIRLPQLELKRAIAGLYCSEQTLLKLEPILMVISTNLEAQMAGELGAMGIESTSSYSLFELFIRKKITYQSGKHMLFLASIAKHLSEFISFSLSSRQVEKILEERNITEEVFDSCLSTGLIKQNLNKISFSHEMFQNFFVADSIVRFSSDCGLILAELEAPKNHDKKLMIIGSIEDQQTLLEVLESITGECLIKQLIAGEAGDFGKAWALQKMEELVPRIESETLNLKFEITSDEYYPVQLKTDSITQWTAQDWGFVHAFPALLLKERHLKKFFDIVAFMDAVCDSAYRELSEEAKKRGICIKSEVFRSAYLDTGKSSSALSRIVNSFQSGFAMFNTQNDVSAHAVSELLNAKSLKYGQFYFLLLLCRYDERTKILYPYIVNALKAKWKFLPYNLKNEILDQVVHCYDTDDQRLSLIEAIEEIHSQTRDPLLSTLIFDALLGLGALEQDTEDYIETVNTQIESLLSAPENPDRWSDASGIYYAQFDHPYDYAFTTAISSLVAEKKVMFFKMAVRGGYNTIFTKSLIIETVKLLGGESCEYLLKWIETPMVKDNIMPQDGFSVFLFTHIILGKFDYVLVSKFEQQSNSLDSTLMACAEVYYWLNRTDLNLEDKKKMCKTAIDFLFNKQSEFIVECIWQSEHSLRNSSYNDKINDAGTITINQIYPNEVAQICRLSLQKPGYQKSVIGHEREDEIALHTLWLLERHGNISDLPLLRKLSDNAVLGESAVRAIRRLES